MKTDVFIPSVDKRSRESMVEYLAGHFRYWTMNSWNLSTGWANNMKIDCVIPDELQEQVFELIQTDEYWIEINALLRMYDLEHDYQYQVFFNGRSGGYLVMCKGGYKVDRIFTFEDCKQYHGRDYADGYGWMSKEEAIEKGLYRKERKTIYTAPGQGVDNYERCDFEAMTIDELREITDRVKEFDLLCNQVVQQTIDLAETCSVEVETIYEPKQIKVLSNCN